MQSKAKSVKDYIAELPAERKKAITEIRQRILKNLPKGFKEEMTSGMIGYVVPHSLYPAGYHVDPSLPLPFMGLASQKNFIAVYHMGVYADGNLMTWFKSEYASHSQTKLDMGKSCIRFKNPDKIPYDLIGELSSKVSVDEWIEKYEKVLRK
ncbi:MAG TPA: DUF1801 domain-containing protein [Chryseosolibacter sp.]